MADNDITMAPGAGFAAHEHRDVEIVTWVLDGTLRHQHFTVGDDSFGPRHTLRPGSVQRLSAGTGIRHAETNVGDGPLRFVQMWVLPDASSIEPGYEQTEIDPARLSGGWATVASGLPHDGGAGVRIQQRDAALYAARLRPGQQVDLPTAPFVHLYVAVGAVDLDGAGHLDGGDAARVSAGGGQRVTATEPAELLAWEMH